MCLELLWMVSPDVLKFTFLSNILILQWREKGPKRWKRFRQQQYMKCELPDVQAGLRKGRGTRDQIANIHWIMEKARESQTNIYFCFIDYAKAFDCVDHNNCA